jgi:hypothetical protein
MKITFSPLVTPVTPKFNIFFLPMDPEFWGPLLCSREGFGVVKIVVHVA